MPFYPILDPIHEILEVESKIRKEMPLLLCKILAELIAHECPVSSAVVVITIVVVRVVIEVAIVIVVVLVIAVVVVVLFVVLAPENVIAVAARRKRRKMGDSITSSVQFSSGERIE